MLKWVLQVEGKAYQMEIQIYTNEWKPKDTFMDSYVVTAWVDK